MICTEPSSVASILSNRCGRPSYESETVQLLRELKEHAEQGDVAWLTNNAVAEADAVIGHDLVARVGRHQWNSRRKLRETARTL
jgi:hypothetical protein